MKHFLPAFRILLFLTLVTGVAYPLLITGIATTFFRQEASGDLILKNQQPIGSVKLAQKFASPKYFWGRPSAIDYNPQSSGGSNLSQNSLDLKKLYDERMVTLKAANPSQLENPPQDLLFASGSGLDPHISPAAAQYQIQRVAKARALNSSQLEKLVNDMTKDRQFGIFGEPTVNVLSLNIALDAQGLLNKE
ncbi:MAG: potassium-transporting ATPase subunit KdpC [Bdellovibrio sp.]|nr:potassium-transporting ATPase subunit KdpC [Bdellovibrio sp.]